MKEVLFIAVWPKINYVGEMINKAIAFLDHSDPVLIDDRRTAARIKAERVKAFAGLVQGKCRKMGSDQVSLCGRKQGRGSHARIAAKRRRGGKRAHDGKFKLLLDLGTGTGQRA